MNSTTDRALQAHLLARATGQQLAIARECDRARRKANRKTMTIWTLLLPCVLMAYLGIAIACAVVSILDL
jgi:hypothetical protein